MPYVTWADTMDAGHMDGPKPKACDKQIPDAVRDPGDPRFRPAAPQEAFAGQKK